MISLSELRLSLVQRMGAHSIVVSRKWEDGVKHCCFPAQACRRYNLDDETWRGFQNKPSAPLKRGFRGDLRGIRQDFSLDVCYLGFEEKVPHVCLYITVIQKMWIHSIIIDSEGTKTRGLIGFSFIDFFIIPEY